MDRDPISGNPVPPGSKPEEVRDDVPANLSEGEYVVPADVVRFFGVNFFEQLREKAKEGMVRMEENGRMGEETRIPPELQEAGQMVEQYAQGGLVDEASLNQVIDKVVEVAKTNPQLSGIFQKRGIMMNEGGLVDGEETTQPTFTPNQWQTTGGSLFSGGANSGAYSQNFEYRPYVGPDGSTQMILFVNGSPAMVIPEGYVPQEDYTESAEQNESPRTPDRDRKDRGRGGVSATPDFVSPLDDLNFDDTKGTQEWAEKNLQTNGVLEMASKAAGPVGGLLGLLPKARGIAEIRAAAFGAENAGNLELAEMLRTRAEEAERRSGILGIVPDEWLNGDRIYSNYRRRMSEREVRDPSKDGTLDLPPEIMRAIEDTDPPRSRRTRSGGSTSSTSSTRGSSPEGRSSVPRTSSYSREPSSYTPAKKEKTSLSYGSRSPSSSSSSSLSFGGGSTKVDSYSRDPDSYSFKKGGFVSRRKKK